MDEKVAFILEKELSDVLKTIYWKWDEGEITLPEVHKLYFLAKEKYLLADDKTRTKEASKLILKILFVSGKIVEQFVRKLQNGQLKPNDKELELLKEGCDEVLAAFDSHFKKELIAYQGKPYSVHRSEVEEKIRRVRNLIQNYHSKNNPNSNIPLQ